MASRCKTDFDLLNLIKETSSPRSVVSTCPTSLSGGTTVEQTCLAGKTTKDETTANLTDLPSDNPERIEEAIDMPDTAGVDIKSSTSNSCQYSTDLETSNSTSENGDYCLSSSLSCEKYAKSDNLPEMQVTEPIQDFSNVDIKCDIVKNDDGAGAAPSLPKEIDTKLGISKIIAVKNKIPKGNVEDGMIRDQDLWCLSKEELVAELRSCREQVVSLQKQLSKSERQVKKADDYNEVLRSSLEKVSSQVHNYKTAKFTEAAIQVDKMDLLNYTTGEPCMPDWGSDNVNMDTEALQSDSYHSVEDQTQNLASDEAPMSLADSIKMAAQEALNKQTQDTMLLQGYVFDENYGLYYHSESGYYYDQEKQLYYDPNSGIYYYYDYNTGQYAFHSQVSSFAGDAFTAYRETDTTIKKVNQKKAGKKPKKIRKLPSSEEGYKNRRERRQALKEKKEQEKIRKLERKSKKKPKEKSRLIEDESVRGDEDGQRSHERSSISSGSRSQSERTTEDKSSRKRQRYSDEDYNSGDSDKDVSEKRNKRKKKKHRKEKSENESYEKNKSVKRRKHKKRKHKKSRHRDEHHKEDKQKLADDANKMTDDSEVGIEDDINQSDPELVDHLINILKAKKSDREQDRIITDLNIEKEGKEVMANNAKSAKDTTDNSFIRESDRTHSHVNFDKDNSGTINGTQTKIDQSSAPSSHESEKKTSESSVSSEESGEVTDSSTSTGESEYESDDSSVTDSGDDVYIVHDFEEYGEQATEQEVAQSWPPCVRVIVTESDFVAVGMLYIVTYQGTTIGREKDNGICIPDINISKCHAEIRFAENDNMFTIIDKGSQNGTFLNEERISKPKQTSEAKAFKHGDVLQVAGTKLLCHIHSGTDTCDECEPGIVMAKYRQQLPKQEVKFISKEERKKIQKKELNEIKRRYGLKNAAFEVRSDVLNNPNYEDKAAERRKTVGSDVSTVVKEAPASVFRPISSENKGHKMLEKMGWKEGESLGKDNSGIQEPIAVSLRVNQSAGLGSASAGIFSPEDANSVDVRKANRRIRAMQRYDVLETTERVANQLSEQIVQMTEDNVSSAIKKLPEKYKMTWSKGDTENT